MVTKFAFWHWGSKNRMANRDRKVAKKLNCLITKIDKLKNKAIKKDIERGDPEGVVRDINKLLDFLELESQGLEKIQEHTQMQNFDLLKYLGTVMRLFVRVSQANPTDQEFKKEVSEIKALVATVGRLIHKARDDARNLKNNHDGFLRYMNILGLHHLARQIKRSERRIRKEVKLEGKDENELERELKAIENKSGKDSNEAVHAGLAKHIFETTKIILELSKKEAKNLYTVEYDDILLEFGLMEYLTDARNILNKILAEGFEPDKERPLEEKYNVIMDHLKGLEKEEFRRDRWMDRHTEKIAEVA